jgi:hypothetical protein
MCAVVQFIFTAQQVQQTRLLKCSAPQLFFESFVPHDAFGHPE